MLRKIFGLFILFISFNQNVKAQFSASDTLAFEALEDSINVLSDSLFNSNSEKTRKTSSFKIIQTLKTALLKENSFAYNFPNLKAISIVQPEDESFRIFTWQLAYNNNTFKYFGAIQINNKDLKLLPLIDNSAMMDESEFSTMTTTNTNWLGALYYGIKAVKSGRKTYYTVFGYDGNNALSTKKVVDVLWFEDNTVKFGAPIFETIDGELLHRFIMEYKKGVSAGIRYSDEYEKIMFDNLIPETIEGEGVYFTYVPDGSYNGFEWKKGKWVYIDKLFDFKLEDGEFPTGN